MKERDFNFAEIMDFFCFHVWKRAWSTSKSQGPF